MGGIGSGRKKIKPNQIAVDSSGNPVEVLTVKQAAEYLGVTKSELKLQLFKKRYLKAYKLSTSRGGTVTRIKKSDLDSFIIDKEMYKRIAEKIRQARKQYVYLVTGLPQRALAKSAKIEREHLNRIEKGKCRVGLPTLRRIARVLDKPVEYFID